MTDTRIDLLGGHGRAEVGFELISALQHQRERAQAMQESTQAGPEQPYQPGPGAPVVSYESFYEQVEAAEAALWERYADQTDAIQQLAMMRGAYAGPPEGS